MHAPILLDLLIRVAGWAVRDAPILKPINIDWILVPGTLMFCTLLEQSFLHNYMYLSVSGREYHAPASLLYMHITILPEVFCPSLSGPECSANHHLTFLKDPSAPDMAVVGQNVYTAETDVQGRRNYVQVGGAGSHPGVSS